MFVLQTLRPMPYDRYFQPVLLVEEVKPGAGATQAVIR